MEDCRAGAGAVGGVDGAVWVTMLEGWTGMWLTVCATMLRYIGKPASSVYRASLNRNEMNFGSLQNFRNDFQ